MSSETNETLTFDFAEEFKKLLKAPRDSRTKDWFLAESFEPLVVIIAAYLFFCIYAGPRLMRNRKPFELKNTLLLYNAVQVALSVYMVYEVSFS